jgi:predicted RNA methylase
MSCPRARYYIRQEANKRGWNTNYLSRGGDFLELKDIPDLIICFHGEPLIMVGTIDAAEAINATKKYQIKFAVVVSGQEDTGFLVGVKYKTRNGWVALTHSHQELTNIPSKQEVELALAADDGTTRVSIPSTAEFIDAAMEISGILRSAKVEPPLRPKVIGAITLAMYPGDISKELTLTAINNLSSQVINSAFNISENHQKQLIDALHLSGANFDRLGKYLGRIISILLRLNIRAVLQTDVDFIGMFYEPFLRYGYDNNALGVVFTPRHITRFCADLLEVTSKDQVIDIACGTGGFLIAAFDRMTKNTTAKVYGFDTNPTVWSLAMVNMFFRGDGRSNIKLGSVFDEQNISPLKKSCTKAFLNPPFSQRDEPEYRFIDMTMEYLEVGGLLAAVVYAGIFADEDHKIWRQEFLRHHSLLAVISLPEDLFYPTSAPTSIMIARAHIPQGIEGKVLMSRVWNDGFEKLKNRRVEREGTQLPLVKAAFQQKVNNEIATTILGEQIQSGSEWSPQQWLPQPEISEVEIINHQQNVIRCIFQAVSYFPDLSEEALKDFGSNWQHLAALPLNQKETINFFFHVLGGKSTGEKNYRGGTTPYISSGDGCNSIIRLVEPNQVECFMHGGITVTAFGQAAVQPWQFLARGNGGSAVRVLIPKFNMGFPELVWFAAQINIQKWRFFYARMAIKSRLQDVLVSSPKSKILRRMRTVAEDIQAFNHTLNDFSAVGDNENKS